MGIGEIYKIEFYQQLGSFRWFVLGTTGASLYKQKKSFFKSIDSIHWIDRDGQMNRVSNKLT